MKLILETDRNGNLIARQAGLSVLRYAIGLPLLILGALCLYGVISNPIIEIQQNGLSGLWTALPGAVLLLILCAFTLPLGWWITFSQHWIRFDKPVGEVATVSSWLIGQREKKHPLANFNGVRLAMEELKVSSRTKTRNHIYIQMIRLLTHRAEDPSLEVGWREKGERAIVLPMAEELAAYLGLPLTVLPDGEEALRPGHEDEVDGKPFMLDEDDE